MRVEELKPGANLFVTSVGGVENLHAKHKHTARASNQVPTVGIIAADSVHQQFLLEDIRTTHLLFPPAKNLDTLGLATNLDALAPALAPAKHFQLYQRPERLFFYDWLKEQSAIGKPTCCTAWTARKDEWGAAWGALGTGATAWYTRQSELTNNSKYIRRVSLADTSDSTADPQSSLVLASPLSDAPADALIGPAIITITGGVATSQALVARAPITGGVAISQAVVARAPIIGGAATSHKQMN